MVVCLLLIRFFHFVFSCFQFFQNVSLVEHSLNKCLKMLVFLFHHIFYRVFMLFHVLLCLFPPLVLSIFFHFSFVFDFQSFLKNVNVSVVVSMCVFVFSFPSLFTCKTFFKLSFGCRFVVLFFLMVLMFSQLGPGVFGPSVLWGRTTKSPDEQSASFWVVRGL